MHWMILALTPVTPPHGDLDRTRGLAVKPEAPDEYNLVVKLLFISPSDRRGHRLQRGSHRLRPIRSSNLRGQKNTLSLAECAPASRCQTSSRLISSPSFGFMFYLHSPYRRSHLAHLRSTVTRKSYVSRSYFSLHTRSRNRSLERK